MKRYIRLYFYFVKFSIISRLEYRFEFIANTVRSIGWLLVSLFGFAVIFSQTKLIAGWTHEESLVLYGVYLFINETWYTFFYLNLTQISDLVQSGEFDFILLKPISTQFLISLRQFMIYSVPNMVLGLGIIVYFSSSVAKQVSLLDYAFGLVLMINGLVILYSLMFMAVCLSFWIVRLRAFWEIYDMATEGARYPVDIFKNPMRFFFMFIVPLAFIFTFPAQFIVKSLSPIFIGVSFFMSSILLFLSSIVLKNGIRHYNSASS